MRAALHTLMFGGYPLERVAPAARDIGYSGVALMCRPPHLDLDNPGPSARAGSSILTDAGLQVVGLASGLGRPEAFTGTPAESELDGVRRALEAADMPLAPAFSASGEEPTACRSTTPTSWPPPHPGTASAATIARRRRRPRHH